jgi:hypothetical protein
MNYNYLGAALYLLVFILGFVTNFAAGHYSLIFANRILLLSVIITGMVSSVLNIQPWVLYGMVSGIVCAQSFIDEKESK